MSSYLQYTSSSFKYIAFLELAKAASSEVFTICLIHLVTLRVKNFLLFLKISLTKTEAMGYLSMSRLKTSKSS